MSEELTRQWLDRHAVELARAYALPDWTSRTYDIWEDASRGEQVLYFGGDREPKRTATGGRRTPSQVSVLYLHGGGFVRRPTPDHLRFCGKLANELWVPLVMPLPRLAPAAHTFDTTDLAEDLYRDLVGRGRRVVLMGDGAGAGVALGVLCRLVEHELPQPLRTVLISPWWDLTLSDPGLPAREVLDDRLALAGLHVLARAWAGDLDLDDCYVSPLLYGDDRLAMLHDVTIVAGERDLLLPDATRLDQRLSGLGVPHDLIKLNARGGPGGGVLADADFRTGLVRSIREAECPRLG